MMAKFQLYKKAKKASPGNGAGSRVVRDDEKVITKSDERPVVKSNAIGMQDYTDEHVSYDTRPGKKDPTLTVEEMTKIPLEKRQEHLQKKRSAKPKDIELPVDNVKTYGDKMVKARDYLADMEVKSRKKKGGNGVGSRVVR